MTTVRKHQKASDQWPPSGPSAMPLEDRPVCQWCGGRYVPGFWAWHAMWNHQHGPYTSGGVASVYATLPEGYR